MKKQQIIYLIVGVIVLVLVAGGWYMLRYRSCLKNIYYTPPREQREIGGGFSGLRRVNDNNKGDYYRFYDKQFRTSNEAIRACIWK